MAERWHIVCVEIAITVPHISMSVTCLSLFTMSGKLY